MSLPHRSACLVDCLAYSAEAALALRSALLADGFMTARLPFEGETSGCYGDSSSEGPDLAILVQDSVDQMYVVNRRMTLDKCKQLADVGSGGIGLALVDVDRAAMPGSESQPDAVRGLQTATTTVTCALADLSGSSTANSGSPHSNAFPIILLDRRRCQAAFAEPGSAPQQRSCAHSSRGAVALCGFLLEYPVIYCMGECQDQPGEDAHQTNNLAEQPLLLFRLMLSPQASGPQPYSAPSSGKGRAHTHQQSSQEAWSVLSFSAPAALFSSAQRRSRLPFAVSSEVEQRLLTQTRDRLQNATAALLAKAKDVGQDGRQDEDVDWHGLGHALSLLQAQIEMETVQMAMVAL